MRQVVVIHGGDVYETYEKYLENLKNEKFDLEDLFYNGWKRNLQKELGAGYQVIALKMPNRDNARYLEWKIWFDKLLPHLKNGVIFIGHSLGGIFLAKYLSMNDSPIKAAATMIVAAPHSKAFNGYMADFVLPEGLGGFAERGGDIWLFYSKDDKVVTFNNLDFYRKDLPLAKAKIFTDRGHFSIESFPEIIKAIKQIQ